MRGEGRRGPPFSTVICLRPTTEFEFQIFFKYFWAVSLDSRRRQRLSRGSFVRQSLPPAPCEIALPATARKHDSTSLCDLEKVQAMPAKRRKAAGSLTPGLDAENTAASGRNKHSQAKKQQILLKQELATTVPFAGPLKLASRL